MHTKGNITRSQKKGEISGGVGLNSLKGALRHRQKPRNEERDDLPVPQEVLTLPDGGSTWREFQ